jgi:hypothetical protein
MKNTKGKLKKSMYLKKTGLNTSTTEIKCLRMSPLLPSCKFVGKPKEVPLNSSIKGDAYRGYTQSRRL